MRFKDIELLPAPIHPASPSSRADDHHQRRTGFTIRISEEDGTTWIIRPTIDRLAGLATLRNQAGDFFSELRLLPKPPSPSAYAALPQPPTSYSSSPSRLPASTMRAVSALLDDARLALNRGDADVLAWFEGCRRRSRSTSGEGPAHRQNRPRSSKRDAEVGRRMAQGTCDISSELTGDLEGPDEHEERAGAGASTGYQCCSKRVAKGLHRLFPSSVAAPKPAEETVLRPDRAEVAQEPLTAHRLISTDLTRPPPSPPFKSSLESTQTPPDLGASNQAFAMPGLRRSSLVFLPSSPSSISSSLPSSEEAPTPPISPSPSSSPFFAVPSQRVGRASTKFEFGGRQQPLQRQSWAGGEVTELRVCQVGRRASESFHLSGGYGFEVRTSRRLSGVFEDGLQERIPIALRSPYLRRVD